MTMLLDWIARRMALWITVSVVLVLTSMWVISASYRAPVGEDQPKVTDWMQGWGSVFGVVAGLAAAGAAAFLLLHERQRAAASERQIAEERADAVLNVPRAVVAAPAQFKINGGGDDKHLGEVVAAVHNYGSNPIRNVAVVVTLPT
ncbi:hypothetical protein, partial [Micromonospora sp. M61]|uniref:hypothetical protein n=1 Tax=Micromonospora sp. M61 TaxID=2824890 RepID=UPI001B3594C4